METLTERQLSVLCAIGAGHYIYSDLMSWLWLSKTNLKHHLDALQARGYLTKVANKAGTIRLTESGRQITKRYMLLRDVSKKDAEVRLCRSIVRMY